MNNCVRCYFLSLKNNYFSSSFELQFIGSFYSFTETSRTVHNVFSKPNFERILNKSKKLVEKEFKRVEIRKRVRHLTLVFIRKSYSIKFCGFCVISLKPLSGIFISLIRRGDCLSVVTWISLYIRYPFANAVLREVEFFTKPVNESEGSAWNISILVKNFLILTMKLAWSVSRRRISVSQFQPIIFSNLSIQGEVFVPNFARRL